MGASACFTLSSPQVWGVGKGKQQGKTPYVFPRLWVGNIHQGVAGEQLPPFHSWSPGA